MQAKSGTYILILSSPARSTIDVGRLGRMTLAHGYYLYVGSAFGPGGLRARIAHPYFAQLYLKVNE